MLDQQLVGELAGEERLVLLCGRYEGFDERIFDLHEIEEISIGDYVLGGGEVAAMVLIEAVARLVPGVVGDPESVVEDSFAGGLLDHPCYTRPPSVEGRAVPEVLTSGNHEAIRRWRLEKAVEATVTRRPGPDQEELGELLERDSGADSTAASRGSSRISTMMIGFGAPGRELRDKMTRKTALLVFLVGLAAAVRPGPDL